MPVSKIVITNLRNLELIEFSPCMDVNVISGANGSGKTSILESIYLLGRGRSFLTSKHRSVVQRGKNSCTVFGHAQMLRDSPGVAIGVTRAIDGSHQIKVAGDLVQSSAPLAKLLPIQVISPGAFSLLDGGPRNRRQYVDWGVFHVEHTFIDYWRKFSRCLRHRNKLLKTGNVKQQIMEPWDRELIEFSQKITEQRTKYVEQLEPLFFEALAEIVDLDGLSIDFYPGWDVGVGLRSVMEAALERDGKSGFTHYGPQRADLRVRYLGLNAAETLSRGQQKLLVCAMKVAQGRLYSLSTGRPCVYLVDDLASELDINHRMALCGLLSKIESQLFVTAVERDVFAGCWGQKQEKLFHVEQGNLIEN